MLAPGIAALPWPFASLDQLLGAIDKKKFIHSIWKVFPMVFLLTSAICGKENSPRSWHTVVSQVPRLLIEGLTPPFPFRPANVRTSYSSGIIGVRHNSLKVAGSILLEIGASPFPPPFASRNPFPPIAQVLGQVRQWKNKLRQVLFLWLIYMQWRTFGGHTMNHTCREKLTAATAANKFSAQKQTLFDPWKLRNLSSL